MSLNKHIILSLLTIAITWPSLCSAAGEPSNAKELAEWKSNLSPSEKADHERKAKMSPDELAWETVLENNLGNYYLPLYKQDKVAGRETAWDYVKDDPSLPRVLIIGDSISRGYTMAARKHLKGTANVHRAPANCGPSQAGLNCSGHLAGRRQLGPHPVQLRHSRPQHFSGNLQAESRKTGHSPESNRGPTDLGSLHPAERNPRHVPKRIDGSATTRSRMKSCSKWASRSTICTPLLSRWSQHYRPATAVTSEMMPMRS